ncbi:MAG TPA: glucans biosynthesis glucosyltransferase MdoH, partial [Arenibaculum sp.]|nr:glucans biosynthesis glucosyltransferase MdoH [Arenibaculum sp.]
MSALGHTALRRRTLYFALVLGSTAAASWLMLEVLRANGLFPLEKAIAVLFTFSFAWIATSFWTATAGFVVRLAGGDPAGLDAAEDEPLTTRTALVMPVYNEDPVRVFAGIEATWRSLEATGEAGAFDVFVLSDTTDPERAAPEHAAWADLVHRLNAENRIFYRRRPVNTGRKAGNIADFVRQW